MNTANLSLKDQANGDLIYLNITEGYIKIIKIK